VGVNVNDARCVSGDATPPQPLPIEGRGTVAAHSRFPPMPTARKSAHMILGWKLDPDQRAELLRQFPPRYRNVIADHVTLRSGVARDAPLPEAARAEIVGRADDGAGVEAMVVRLDGATGRPDGSTFHITWSLAEGRRAKESNDVIAARGWVDFDLPMPILLTPARWP